MSDELLVSESEAEEVINEVVDPVEEVIDENVIEEEPVVDSSSDDEEYVVGDNTANEENKIKVLQERKKKWEKLGDEKRAQKVQNIIDSKTR